jgi:hypothetical protein
MSKQAINQSINAQRALETQCRLDAEACADSRRQSLSRARMAPTGSLKLERTIGVVTHCKPTQPLAAGLSCSVDDCIHKRPTRDDQESAAVWLAS